MKEVIIPTSKSYKEYLISSLQDVEEAAAYLETFLQLDEEGREPEVLRSALKNIIDARLAGNNLSQAAKQKYQQLDQMLSDNSGDEIYSLIEFLDALGYRIKLEVKDS
ncbi:helix-turn-helix domain-containing transcriptional regulator [Sphaerospermopsis torques-reginae]|uniref:Transcriptional regulator n=1 Tax=Sphaerospermopsis torques-reginae ITEP-024 TaxID=984208 RepID=A0ABX8WYA5_9CYAN|nr:transcriptional regulator [Sphaerospermopsis torques-reginae]QYX31434.1 transcriptional regulator [Sphaerospermopsis torques-reginae ITEP-024]